MHKIKKYINRKMYDTTDKKYVSMDQIARLIKSGEEVSIIDNKTGEDLTAAIVSRLIGQDKKEKGSVVSPRIMMQLLRKGGDTLTDYAKKYTAVWQNALTLAEDEVDKLVGALVSNKELSRAEGSRLKQEITGYTDSLKSWIGERVDRRISEALAAMNLASRDQVEALTAKLDKLSKEVARLKKSSAPAKTKKAGGAGKKRAGKKNPK
jgi:polyhydroxyalkanoate synthesis repressor PhaR